MLFNETVCRYNANSDAMNTPRHIVFFFFGQKAAAACFSDMRLIESEVDGMDGNRMEYFEMDAISMISIRSEPINTNTLISSPEKMVNL